MDLSKCRFCLQSCKEENYELTLGGAIINKILICFSHMISNVEHLPNSICKVCFQKVDEIVAFRETIIDSENLLLSKLNITHSEVQNKMIKDEIDSDTDSEADQNRNEDVQSEITDFKIEKTDKDTIELKNDNSFNCILQLTDLKRTNDRLSLKNISEIKINTINNVKTEEDINKQPSSDIQGYTCLMCFKKFPNKSVLLKHYITEERIKRKLLTESEFNIKVEVKTEGTNKLFVCRECKEEFKTASIIIKHLNSHFVHYVCRLCGRIYHKASDILNHGKSHSDVKIYCSYNCGYSTSYAHLMKNHERRHTKEYKYNCQQCGKGFQVRTWYEQHQNIHKGVKQYVCNICGASFHMHRYLTSHTTAIHSGVTSKKRFACLHCSATFGSKSSLTIHLQEHGVKTDHLCDCCGKVFKNSRQMSHHRRTHSKEKRYKCRTCSKTFPKKFNMVQHEMSHTDFRFRCSKCSASYKQRSSLNRHTASKHSKEDSKKS